MTYSIAALGESGARLLRALLFAAVAGVLPEGQYRLTLIGAASHTEQELQELVQCYGSAQKHLTGRHALGCTVEMELCVWPEEAEERLSLAEQAEREEDQLLCRALFTREQAALSPRHALDASGPVAAMTLASLLGGTSAETLWQRLEGDAPVLLLAGLCEPVGASGVAALADFVVRCGGAKPCAVLLLPLCAGEDASLCRAALASGRLDERLSAAFVAGLPEGNQLTAGGDSLVDWLAALAGVRLLRGEWQGVSSWEMPADGLSWEVFGAEGVSIRAGYDAALRTACMMNAHYGPQLCGALASHNWLRDRMLTWYARHFEAARQLDERAQNALVQDVQDVMALYGALAGWLREVQEHLPACMHWPEAMRRASLEAEEHYQQVLELAGQAAWLRYEMERSGLVNERAVRRGAAQETEADAAKRQLEELLSKLQVCAEEQTQLFNRIGGAAARQMLTRIRRNAETEAETLAAQAKEGRRRVAYAAEIATPEEMAKVDTARVRLDRMDRHVALLRGRAEQARQDEAWYADARRRASPPMLEIKEEKPAELYPEALLKSVNTLAAAEGRTIKQLGQLVYEVWPWRMHPPRRITEAMNERPLHVTQDCLGDFLAHLLLAAAGSGEEEQP